MSDPKFYMKGKMVFWVFCTMGNRSGRVRTPNSVGNYSNLQNWPQNFRISTLNSTVLDRLDWNLHRISSKEFCVQWHLIWPNPTSLFEMRATIRKTKISQNRSSAARKPRIDLGPLAFDSPSKVGSTIFSPPPSTRKISKCQKFSKVSKILKIFKFSKILKNS